MRKERVFLDVFNDIIDNFGSDDGDDATTRVMTKWM